MDHVLGVIGGSGLYAIDGLTDVEELVLDTPFGRPSDTIVRGRLGGTVVCFLPRHGRGHRFTPSEVPYRANIHAMKQLGVGWILSVSAVGSLREEIVPGHVVLPDQFIDRTYLRAPSFFGEGCVAHVGFGDPVCETLRGMLREAATDAGATVHDGGTYVVMEGPAFSTKAESELHRSWGASVIGMTNLPEAKLAREAGISYATLALATDYDCWHPDHDHVTVDAVIATVQANVALARDIVRRLVPRVAAFEGPPPHHAALQYAIMTAPERIPAETRARLALLIDPWIR
jgi:5'-methylthioadenosine phosphorylase